MKKLDHLITSARDGELDWNAARAARVLSCALDRRERRATRARVMRRALVVGSAAAMIGFVFLRGANASSSATNDVQPSATIAVAETFGDAGYARD